MAFLPFSLSFLLPFLSLCFSHSPLPTPSPSPPSVFPLLCCLLLSSPFPRLSFLTLSVHHSLLVVRSLSFFLSTFFGLFSLPQECPEDKKTALCRTSCIFQRLHPYHYFPYKEQFPFQIPYKFSQDWHLGMKQSRITGFLWKFGIYVVLSLDNILLRSKPVIRVDFCACGRFKQAGS